MRLASSSAALFEENHTIRLGIEETTVIGDQTCAWSTMQKHNRLAVRGAALLVIELVNRGDADVTAVVRFDLVVKGSQCFHSCQYSPATRKHSYAE